MSSRSKRILRFDSNYSYNNNIHHNISINHYLILMFDIPITIAARGSISAGGYCDWYMQIQARSESVS